MKLLISGSRRRQDKDFIFSRLDEIHAQFGVTELVEGGATGIDAIGHIWAILRGIKTIKIKAEWTKYGRAAGPLRNQRMLDEEKPEMLLAAPDSESIGTLDMIKRARKAGIPVRIV